MPLVPGFKGLSNLHIAGRYLDRYMPILRNLRILVHLEVYASGRKQTVSHLQDGRQVRVSALLEREGKHFSWDDGLELTMPLPCRAVILYNG